MSGAALAGVVGAGVALVLLSALFLWAVHFRKREPARSPFRRASKAVRHAKGRMAQRSNHVRLDTKEFATAGTTSGNVHDVV
jgi:hypothetical protein